MTRYEWSDVVLVDVVFSDGSGVKKRPALVVSTNEYNKARQEIIIAAITSNIQRMLPGDTKIKDWEKAGLLFPSLVTGIIQTIKVNLISRKLGKLQEADLKLVQENLRRIVAF